MYSEMAFVTSNPGLQDPNQGLEFVLYLCKPIKHKTAKERGRGETILQLIQYRVQELDSLVEGEICNIFC